MTKDEALQMAMQTLEIWKGFAPRWWDKTDEQTVTAIKTVLARSTQEPEWVDIPPEQYPDVRYQRETYYAGIEWAKRELKERNT